MKATETTTKKATTLEENMRTLKVRLTFLEPLLGTSPADPEIYKSFVASKAPDANTLEDEVAALGVDGVVENALTVFPRTKDGTPFLYDYQIKGFFKDTCGGLRRVPVSKSSKVKAYKKEIDKLVFVFPRQIPISFEGDIGNCQRPLRASTAQGDRVALANSEEIPEGATVEFEIRMFDQSYEPIVREWLDYGIYSGIGQWRNSGKGRFEWEEIS